MGRDRMKPLPTNQPQVLRHPVSYRYTALNWEFLKLMAELASMADAKYEDAEQYTGSELTGNRAPLNHIAEHLRQYITMEPYDQLNGDMKYHLAAIAYNAMMEFFYYIQRGSRPAHSPVNNGQIHEGPAE